MNNGDDLKYLQDRVGQGCGGRLPWVSAVPGVAEISLGPCQGFIRPLLQSCGPAAASLQMLKGKEERGGGQAGFLKALSELLLLLLMAEHTQ